MTRYRECDKCGFRVEMHPEVDGWNFAGWGVEKECCLCPGCNLKYVNLKNEMDNNKNEALNKFLKL